ncbi:MAG: UTP--glucose-1-phosphate uridylyltransferase [Desulfobacteraceae bacterium]|nr:UTP--glucose-1-phosphate uridylyltransferase [Desulfobacteraceae bacterium]MBC2719498.1 UTP--glucose-1-phosphate uridylyltransferase [Desulfobacteraceae bacterium]
MKKEGIQPIVIDTFVYYYEKLVAGEKGFIFDRDIRPINSDEIEDARDASEYAEAGEKALKHVVMIILNGGLGTTMGMKKAKSLIRAKDNKTFLEIILEKAKKSNVALCLMNSFSTHQDTISALSMIKPYRFPKLFLQHKFPKILRHEFAPADWPMNQRLEWNPPGHGDIYTALLTSGTLQQLLDEGIRYAFIANSDNLVANIDKSLLGFFSEKGFPFMMEVSERMPIDFKGGHMARHKNGHLILREAAQCPKRELEKCRDVINYKFFNTNNIWLDLKILKSLIEKHGTIKLPMIINPKNLDPRNEFSPLVYQIETAMGSAISIIEGATAIRVPRSRFFPVKTCNELLAVRSDCFLFSDDKQLIVNPERKQNDNCFNINIDLDPRYYRKIDMFNKRFANGIPSLVNCESLTISGDVFFENNVKINGNVVINNRSGSHAVIKEGAVIEEDIYS